MDVIISVAAFKLNIVSQIIGVLLQLSKFIVRDGVNLIQFFFCLLMIPQNSTTAFWRGYT